MDETLKTERGPDEVSKCFKDVFSDEKGKIVLAKIVAFGGGYPSQVLAHPESTNLTFFNLGANAVVRYIQNQINAELNNKQTDCVIEDLEKTGD